MSRAVQEDQEHYSERTVADAVLISDSLTEPEHFSGIFDRHAPAIHRYAARRLGLDAADDLVAETFLLTFAQTEPPPITRLLRGRGHRASGAAVPLDMRWRGSYRTGAVVAGPALSPPPGKQIKIIDGKVVLLA